MLDPSLIGRLVVLLGLVMLATIAAELALGLVFGTGIVALVLVQGGMNSSSDLFAMLLFLGIGVMPRLAAAIPAGLLVIGGRSFAMDSRSPLGIASLAMALVVPGCGAAVDFLTLGGFSCLVAPWWMLLWASGLILGIMGLVVVAEGSRCEAEGRTLPG